MKNVDLEQKYFTLQQENSHLHSQNESLRSATNSETCSLLSSSEYAAVVLDPTALAADSPMPPTAGSPRPAAGMNNASNGHHYHHADLSPDIMTDQLARMREQLIRLAAEKQEVVEEVERNRAECTAVQQQLGKATRLP
jgi:hypothetical protein